MSVAEEQATLENKGLEHGVNEVKIHGKKVRARGSAEQRAGS